MEGAEAEEIKYRLPLSRAFRISSVPGYVAWSRIEYPGAEITVPF